MRRRSECQHPNLVLFGARVTGGASDRPPSDAAACVCLEESAPQGFHGVVLWLPIPNFGVPRSAPAFDRTVTHAVAVLQAGGALHVGCMAGHGRTGMFLSALAHRAQVPGHPIDWVRREYCKHAVETAGQQAWFCDRLGLPAPETSPLCRSTGRKRGRAVDPDPCFDTDDAPSDDGWLADYFDRKYREGR